MNALQRFLLPGLLLAVAAMTYPAACAAQAAGFDHEYGAFARLLARYVHDGRVDYAGLKQERAALGQYTRAIGAVDAQALARFTRDEQLAYWLNAYNAFVLATIVDHYPIERGSLVGLAFPANSIWQISGAFKAERFQAGGRRVSLDGIEHEIIRPGFREPRIHMALVCAAISCPPLRNEPYRAAVLDAQLDSQARGFVDDARNGVRIAEAREEVRISPIFKWFAEDFAAPGADRPESGVLEFVASHSADPARAALLRSGRLNIRYLDYDWTLNE